MAHLRRTILTRLGAILLLATTPFVAYATYPERPVRIIVPGAPASSLDIMARLIAAQLPRHLGQPVVIENKAGASTAIGAQSLASAPADGYTLMLASNSTFTLNPALSRHKLAYDSAKDFEPIATVADLPLVLAIHTSTGIDSVQELVAAAKAMPEKYQFSSFGRATGAHFAGAMFEVAAGVKLFHVPYQGGPAAMNAVLGNQVQLTMNSVSVVLPHIKAGTVKALAVTTPGRSGLLPDVPTMAEAGYPAAVVEGWSAIVVPRGTPPEVKSRLQAALAAVMGDATLRKQLVEAGFDPAHRSIPNWSDFIAEETARYRLAVERTGLNRD